MKTIGIVGGVGPYAGVDLFQKILEQTKAQTDQEHLPVLLFSLPNKIHDRTGYLLGYTSTNPGTFIAKVIDNLYKSGAEIVAIPCNTAHADPIFNEIIRRMPKQVKLLHLIEEVALSIQQNQPDLKNIGVLSTTGTMINDLYPYYLAQRGLNAIQVSDELQQNKIQPAIYNKSYGIKTNTPLKTKHEAKNNLIEGMNDLIEKGAEAIILGCTEIPLLLPESHFKNIPLIDPSQTLARALILASNPDSLASRD